MSTEGSVRVLPRFHRTPEVVHRTGRPHRAIGLDLPDKSTVGWMGASGRTLCTYGWELIGLKGIHFEWPCVILAYRFIWQYY